MTGPSPDLIERLQQAGEEAKATIRELHQARKDALQAKRELQEMTDRVRAEVVEGFNELARNHWQESMDAIQLTELGAGLKRTFGQWTDLLARAEAVLRDINARDAELARLIDAYRSMARP